MKILTFILVKYRKSVEHKRAQMQLVDFANPQAFITDLESLKNNNNELNLIKNLKVNKGQSIVLQPVCYRFNHNYYVKL